MSAVVFVEHEGKRIDITNAERIIETRCDVCGEYVPKGESVTVGVSVGVSTLAPRHSTLEGHPEHVFDKVARLLAEAVRELDS